MKMVFVITLTYALASEIRSLFSRYQSQISTDMSHKYPSYTQVRKNQSCFW